MNKKQVDTLLIHAHLFTMQGNGLGYIADGAIAVQGSQIVAVDSTEALLSHFEGNKTINAINCAVLPGLIDAHIHTTCAILRGVAQDVTNWLMDATIPYALQMTPAVNIAGTRLSVLEGLKAGTTTFGDSETPYPLWGEFFDEIGVRAILSPAFNAFPLEWSAWKEGDLYPFDMKAGRRGMEEAVDFACAWNGAAEGRITTMLGLQAADMLPLEILHAAKEIAQREGLMLHIHVAQGDRETKQIVKRYGKRPIAFLAEIGYLDEQLLAVHLTDATDEEVIQVAKSGAGMALCSGAIGIIDGLVPPAHVFRQAGGSVALGSDQACGNNCCNIFNEMKLTALFNKIKYHDPTIMPAWEVLRMATIEGAQAIGLDHKIGSLQVGKEADLILIDLSSPNLSPTLLNPIRNLVPNLVYAASGHEVKSVMVAGKLLVEDYQVLTVDESAILAEAQVQAQQLCQRVTADPIHKKMVLMEAMAKGKL
ncbi:amidohydrolase family protein [Cylindrospermopsis raciborskii CS-506_D]|uniref:Amidohydrolase family protein n=1 Tax=Cylindrospermopsis raciborskii CS-506_A TaxID=2585140 RepID=A0A838WIT1_9CYAN|nr:amidohydrolase family protein [Cylindrospermopsis raciborskii]MBA4444526.1 amidohydrolase family protein [Cylindrospermopsis raciborskii CS-506_C]MBA4448745.1 amidohydrolase family protein [Cylindrospermopsis raciborskii CS-506_D]MBA4455372.1 amidohydrolase family protein [Cylindrospermopsis raciborskii CS-506_B]MBA4464725.1 amidohydrolase family protein [Cylindrospermopsis raciborskii CS-506_A]